jgi:hypothetical protein
VKTEAKLIDHLVEETKKHWDKEEQPYLLSLVATDLRDEGVNYAAILKDERLKSFIKRIADQGAFKFVEHPSQRAKIGLIPNDKEFSFSADERGEEASDKSLPRAHGDQAVISFLRALSRLPDALLDEVVIPTKVLVKLLSRR